MTSNWCIVPGHFSREWCEELRSWFTEPTPSTVLEDGERVSALSRKSEIRSLERGAGDLERELFPRLDQLAAYANQRYFDVDFQREGAPWAHLERYGEGGHFASHQDSFLSASPHTLLDRKLTVMVQLSGGAEYRGGDHRFSHLFGEYHPNPDELRIQGTVLVFPSLIPYRVEKVERGERFLLTAWYLGYPWK